LSSTRRRSGTNSHAASTQQASLRCRARGAPCRQVPVPGRADPEEPTHAAWGGRPCRPGAGHRGAQRAMPEGWPLMPAMAWELVPLPNAIDPGFERADKKEAHDQFCC
jgi:hypothetical protein